MNYADMKPSEVRQLIREGKIDFQTSGMCNGFAQANIGMCYTLPSREVITDSVEVMVEGHRYDGMILVGGCDKIVPALLMAAARLDIPAIVVTGISALRSA